MPRDRPSAGGQDSTLSGKFVGSEQEKEKVRRDPLRIQGGALLSFENDMPTYPSEILNTTFEMATYLVGPYNFGGTTDSVSLSLTSSQWADMFAVNVYSSGLYATSVQVDDDTLTQFPLVTATAGFTIDIQRYSATVNLSFNTSGFVDVGFIAPSTVVDTAGVVQWPPAIAGQVAEPDI